MPHRSHTRVRRTAGVLVGAGAVLAAGGLVAGTANGATSVTVTVSGTVTDSSTGQALAGICVRPFGWFTDSACTDAELSDDAGAYTRVFTVPGGPGRSGFLVAETNEFQISKKSQLKITTDTEYVVDISVTPVGTLTGKAVDRAGDPIVDACPEVRSLDTGGSSTAPNTEIVPTCSAEDGVWTLAKIRPGKAVVAIKGTDTLQASYVPTGSRIDLAKSFDVVAGQAVELPTTVMSPGGTVVVHTDAAAPGRNIITLVPTKRTQDLVPGIRFTTGAEADEGDPLNPTLTNIQAGEYRIAVENVWPSDDCYDEDVVCSSFVPWWAPGVIDPSLARPVRIAAGATVDLTAAMKPYREIQLTFPTLPVGTAVTVQAYFADTGKAWSLPLDVIVNAYGNATAKFLPPTDVKLKFIAELDTGRKVWWLGGTSIKDARVVPAARKNLRIPIPVKTKTS